MAIFTVEPNKNVTLFDKDTRRIHRFLIDTEEVKGTIYSVRGGERGSDKLTIFLEKSREKTATKEVDYA